MAVWAWASPPKPSVPLYYPLVPKTKAPPHPGRGGTVVSTPLRLSPVLGSALGFGDPPPPAARPRPTVHTVHGPHR